MWSVVPLQGKKLGAPIKHIQNTNEHVKLKHGMATCHSLTLINGELSGDPLDLKVSAVVAIFPNFLVLANNFASVNGSEN